MPSTPMRVVLDEDRHWWFASRTRAILAILDRYIGANSGCAVLDVGAGGLADGLDYCVEVGEGDQVAIQDVGAGAGNMMHHLAAYGQVVGVDNHPRPIAVARQRGYDVRFGDAQALPFEEGQFDLVALLDTVEHCPDDLAVLRECWRVTRPGGHLLVTTPAFMWLWSHNDVLNRHQRRYTARELSERIEQAGYQTRFISYNNFLVFPLAALLILMRRWLGRRPDLASPHFDADAYQVEMEPTAPWLNRLLSAVGQIEAALLRKTALPIGTSILALAQRPPTDVSHAR